MKETTMRKPEFPRTKNWKACDMSMKGASAKHTELFHHTGSFTTGHKAAIPQPGY